MTQLDLRFRPVTPDRWPDFETLFGERGAIGGCWCMWWRLKSSEYEEQKGAGNRKSMKAIADSGQVPGILAYDGDQPVAWCSVAPRDDFPRINRSRVLKKVDDTPVWSIACFFIHKDYRGKGISLHVLRGAMDYAREQGAETVEGYPVEPKKAEMPTVYAWTGFSSVFKRAGFEEVERRSETRPIMRYTFKN